MSAQPNVKGIREYVGPRAAALAKIQAQRSLTADEAAEVDNLDRLLAECERVEAALTGEARSNATGVNRWTRSQAAMSDIGRENVSYANGQRTVGGNGSATGGVKYTDLRGNEIRTFGRGESYADHIGADRDFSLGLALRGCITGNWAGADREQRLMTTVQDTAGGFLLTPEMSAQVIDLARAKSSVFRAGARLVPMQTNELYFAKLLSDPTSEWASERAGISASDASFGQIRLTSRTLACLCSVSIPLLEDSPNMPQVIENAVLASIANEWDRSALRGTGTGQPLGVANQTGIGTITGVGTPSYDDICDAIKLIEDANGTPNAWILNSRDANTFRKDKDGEGAWLPPPPDVAALTKVQSNQIPADISGSQSEMFVGDFSQCIIGVRSSARLETFRSGGDSSSDAVSGLKVYIRCYVRTDVGLALPAHFVLLSGVTA